MIRKQVEKINLAYLPTPVHELKNVVPSSNGPRLLIKRDDLTGLALGGNKTRKLEYLIADALNKNADIVVTAGAAQSNHCRQTAAAAAMNGLACVLLLGGEEVPDPDGNAFLDGLFGAHIIWTGKQRQGESLETVSDRLGRAGYSPYIIPYGASNPLGVLGYVHAMEELQVQLAELKLNVDRIVVPTSSCGTQAGLILGADIFQFKGSITGICVDKENMEGGAMASSVAKLCTEAAELTGHEGKCFSDKVHLESRYSGREYGIPEERDIGAILKLAASEGILLDPVYTGKAMAALLDMVENGEFSSTDTVLFWHTGGVPSLFAYRNYFKFPQGTNVRLMNELNEIIMH